MSRPAPYPMLAEARAHVDVAASQRSDLNDPIPTMLARCVLAVAEALHRLADAQEGIRR